MNEEADNIIAKIRASNNNNTKQNTVRLGGELHKLQGFQGKRNKSTESSRKGFGEGALWGMDPKGGRGSQGMKM